MTRKITKSSSPYRKAPYNKRLPKSSKPIDWDGLWKKASVMYDVAEMPRMKAVLENFKADKEKVLRSLGIVCEADLVRIRRQLEGKRSSK